MPMFPLYKKDFFTALQNDEGALWQISQTGNEFCKTAIRNHFRHDYQNQSERSEVLSDLITTHGIDRMRWVLAFSIAAHAEQFSERAQQWAASVVPEGYPMDEAQEWILHDHFAETAALAEVIARQYTRMHLIEENQCAAKIGEQDLTGKLLVIDHSIFTDDCRNGYAQLFYVTSAPEGSDSVKGYHLSNGQRQSFPRRLFFGAADEQSLPAWAAQRLSQIRAPQMQIRIFQIDHEKNNQHRMFRGYEETQRLGGVDASTYRQIYGGTVNCKTLDDVYALCNLKHPPGYLGRSLSVSDVVEICSGEGKGFYFCDTFGFQKIDFEIDKTDHEKMLTVLICEPGKEPYVAEILDTYKAMQSVVGGLIEPIYFEPENKAVIFCDEEFLYKGYAPNRMVGDCLVQGTFLIVGNGIDDEGEQISVSLTDAQIKQFSEDFCYPLIYVEHGSQELSEEESEALDFSQT